MTKILRMNSFVVLILIIILLFLTLPALAQPFSPFWQLFNRVQNNGGLLNELLESRIESLSLEAKVGQLFLVGFDGPGLNPEIKDLIKNYQIGGIIYFSRNIENPAQIAELSNELQTEALRSGAEIPLFIAVDQEGGNLRRIKDISYFPANKLLGRKDDPELMAKIGRIIGSELKNLGININLAPVLDVNNNPNNQVIGDRSFGGDPKLVARLGRAYIKGLQAADTAAAAKHFPGHGDTVSDSHTELPTINHPRNRLDRVELYPFKKAIEVGVDMIMTAHIYFPAIEKEVGLPATLSKAVLTDLLREDLAFEGLIITDDLEMEAVAANFNTAEAAVQTIEAGSDLILIAHSYQKQKRAIEAVLKAVKSGRISEKRIDQSLKRILKVKGKRINLKLIN